MTSLTESSGSNYNDLIRASVKLGYRVDLSSGDIFTPDGQKLALKAESDGDLRVRLRNPDTKKRYRVRAARVVAYVAFGELVFSPMVGIAHRDGDKNNISAGNLVLIRRQSSPAGAAPIEPLVTAETDSIEDQLQEANRMLGYMGKALREELNRKRKNDEFDRKNPYLRAVMVNLMPGLDDLIDYYGNQLARAIEGSRHIPLFRIDSAKNLIVWQLLEFLSQGQFERFNEPNTFITEAHQLTPAHARDWFDVDIFADDEVLYVDGKIVSNHGVLVGE